MNKDQTFTQTDISQFFGISNRTLRAWTLKGMPKIATNKYSLSDCCRWHIDRLEIKIEKLNSIEELKSARLRLLNAKALSSEIDLSIKKGAYIDVNKIDSVIERSYLAVRSKLLSLPHRLAPVLINKVEVIEVKMILENEIYNTLKELSKLK